MQPPAPGINAFPCPAGNLKKSDPGVKPLYYPAEIFQVEGVVRQQVHLANDDRICPGEDQGILERLVVPLRQAGNDHLLTLPQVIFCRADEIAHVLSDDEVQIAELELAQGGTYRVSIQ